jgi:hypothetical protein
MRKCPQKDQQEVEVYSYGSQIICLQNYEFDIQKSTNNSYAQLKGNYAHSIPNETSVQK